jgi:WD40 repeat protein
MLPSSSRFRVARGAKVWSTAASPDGRFVARATTARQLILTDRTSNREFELSAQQVTSIAFLSDGESFVAAGSDGRVTLWDAANGELLRTILTHTDGLRSIAVSSADGSVAVGGRDGAVLMFDLATGRSMGTLPVFSSAVNCVRFSPDGRQLAVATGDWNSDAWGTVMLVNVADGQAIVKLDCPTTPGALSFASNEELIVGMWNGHAQLWNLTNQQVVGVATSDKNVIAAAAFSPDNPALLEVTFAAAKPASSEMKSPFTILQELLGTQ